jgi:hypothetical protein
MVKRSFLILVLIAAVLLSSCAPAASMPPAPSSQSKAAGAPLTVNEAPQADSFAKPDQSNASLPGGQDIQRVVIRNANLSIVVVDPASVLAEVTKMAGDMGGFVVTSQLFKSITENGLEVPEANITIRVPAEKLEPAMDQIKALVKDPKKDILSENVTGQDVTKEYTDLKSQLANLVQAEKRLQNIMDSAVKIEDVMTVYNQLVQVQQQIEVLKGQIQYYDEASRLSAISVAIKAEASIAPLTVGSWMPVGTARNALQALLNTLKFLANAAIWIILFFVPILIVIAIPIWLLIVILKVVFRKNKKKTIPPTPPAVK